MFDRSVCLTKFSVTQACEIILNGLAWVVLALCAAEPRKETVTL